MRAGTVGGAGNRCNPGGEVYGEHLPDLRLDLGTRLRFTYRLLTDPGDIAEAQILITNQLAERRFGP